MKTDMYTKVVLTVIAIFLGVIIFQNISLVPTVQASPAPIPEPAMALQSGVIDVNIVEINGEKLGNPYDGLATLPVYNYGN